MKGACSPIFRISLLFSLIFISLNPLFANGPEVPEKVSFCGMRLILDNGAQREAQEIVDQLHRSPAYFKRMVERTDTYLPWVEKGLREAGAPDDLKYVVLLESGLRGDVISSSNAVGFWQFKAATGRHVGLQIDEEVDLRMHIYEASKAAGKYFVELNGRFDNWIYAVIGYNQGPAGAMKHIDERNFGKKDLKITRSTHRYALKSIAYLVAFQDYVGRNEQPEVWLKPMVTEGDISVRELARTLALEEKTFREFNLWIRKNRIPEGEYICFVPQFKTPVDLQPFDTLKVSDPVIASNESSEETDEPTTPTGLESRKFTRLPFAQDRHAGKHYVRAKQGETLAQVASRIRKSYEKLKRCNPDAPTVYSAGDVVRLKPVERAKFHIVKKGETLSEIAHFYGLDVAKVRRKNRMPNYETAIYAGQKLYLRRKKPKEEKILLLE